MAKAEILAPCGGFDSLTAALPCGADAVYFGAGEFNARRAASNFDDKALREAARLCRLYGTRWHLTLNTLVSDEELPRCRSLLARVCRLSADALILQDLGVLRLVRAMCPEMELHASTQMSVGTKAGLRLLRERGFSRAVLPRELTKSEIEALCQADILETEVFVHGAQCMCVSGQCLFSAVLGSRSGNRGLCAQPCRLPFKAAGGTGHDLSLKDLSLIEHITELQQLGVNSFKIEGRMKRPEYVAAAVTACKAAQNGAYTEKQRADLQALFSRSGFSDGYFENRRGRTMFGTRQKGNVTAATSELLKSYAKLYEKPPAVRAVDFTFQAEADKLPSLTAVCGTHRITVNGGQACETAQHVPLTAESVEKQLKKCGGTVFFTDTIDCQIGENLRLPLSEINAMRRAALEALEESICEKTPLSVKDIGFTSASHIAQAPKRYLRFCSLDQIPENARADRMFLPLGTPQDVLEAYHAGVYLPRGIFGTEEAVRRQLLDSGAPYALCDTLDAVAVAQEAGIPVIGGAFLNLYNSLALEEAAQIGVSEAVLSHELRLSQIAALGGALPRGVCVYGHMPLMLTRNCPVRNGTPCAKCDRTGFLTDRKGVRFPVRCENGFSQVYNSRPTYMLDRLREIQNVDFYFLDFTVESKEECAQILDALETGAAPRGEFTRGLFYRGVE